MLLEEGAEPFTQIIIIIGKKWKRAFITFMSQGIASAEGCLVGQVDAKSEAHYGRLLAPLLMREGTVFAWCSVHSSLCF